MPRVSQLVVEVLGADPTGTPQPTPDGQIDITADYAGTFGTRTDGEAIFTDQVVNPAWWTSDDSQTGFEQRQDGVVHFANVPLPNGATIVKAWLGVTRGGEGFGGPIYDEFNDEPNYPGWIYGELDEDPAAPVDTSDATSRLSNLTSETFQYPDQDGVGAPDFNWYEITSIVQEIRSSGGHANGGDMQLFLRNLRDERGSSGDVWATSYGWGGSDPVGDNSAPRLIIEYVAPPPETHYASASVDATASVSAAVADSLLTDLVSCWPLNEASGTALDAHGTNDLTDNNTVGAAAGKIAGGRDYERSNSESHTISSNSSLQAGDIDLTIAGWVNLESKPGGNMALFGKWGVGSNEYLVYHDAAADRFAFSVTHDGTTLKTVQATSFGAPNTATWCHVLAYHDATNDVIGIQVNNGTADTTSHTTGIFVGTSDFRIGWTGNVSAGWFDGVIDEVPLWKRLLTTGEKARLYNGGDGKAYPFVYRYASSSMQAAAFVSVSVDVTKPTSAALTASTSVAASPSVRRVASASMTAVASVSPVVTEAFFKRSASMTTTATVTASSKVTKPTSVDMTATASVSASSKMHYVAATSMTGTATLGVLIRQVWQREVDLTATATVTASLKTNYRTSSSMTATGSATASFIGSYRISASLTASTSVVCSVRRIAPLSASMTGSADVVANNGLRKPLSASLTGSGIVSASGVRSLLASSAMIAGAGVSISSRLYKPTSASMTVSATVSAANGKRLSVSKNLTGSASVACTSIRSLIVRNNLTASSSVSVAATRTVAISCSLSGSVSLSCSSWRSLKGSASLASASSLSANATRNVPASSSMTGTGTVSIYVTRKVPASSSMVGSGSVAASGIRSLVVRKGLTGNATVQAKALQNYVGSSSMSGAAIVSANYWQHVGEGLLDYLLTDATLTGLVGDRIFPHFWPQDEPAPAIVYTFGLTEHDHVLRRNAGVAQTELTFSVFAWTAEERDEVSEAIHAAVVDFSGRWGAVDVLSVYANAEADGAEIDGYRFRQLDYTVVFRESRPFNVRATFDGDASIEDAITQTLEMIAPTYSNWIECEDETETNVIRYRRTGVERATGLGGEQGHDRITLEIVSRSKRRSEVYRTANKIRCRLDGFVGVLGETGVMKALLLSDRDGVGVPNDGSDDPFFEVAQTFVFGVQRI